MVNIGVVYNIVRDLCNKDQKGFVTPAVFNTLAEAAQMNIYNEMFNELKLATKLRRAGSDAGRDKSAYKMVEEDLSYFIKSTTLNVAGEEDSTITTDAEGNQVVTEVEQVARVSKPYDLSKVISMSVFDTNTSVEIIYDAEKAKRVLNSNLSAPSEAFPVALFSGYYIDIFPQTISSDILMTYYRKPVAPLYRSFTVGGVTFHDEGDSVNFELPDHYLTEVVAEIVRMIGVRLRDDVLTKYGIAETTSK